MTASSFKLEHPWRDVTVNIPAHVELTREELMEYPAFSRWLKTMFDSLTLQSTQRDHRFHKRNERYRLISIDLESLTRFGKRIGFLKLTANVKNGKVEQYLPGTIFMRGGSVAILIVLRSKVNPDERWVVMTEQPRIPAGSLGFFEIPAGMVDDAGSLHSAAATELKEETGLDVLKDHLVDMTELALEESDSTEPHLEKAMYLSPGGSDEYIGLFLWERTMGRMEMNEIKGKLTGGENEHIKLSLVRLDQVWKTGARDAKTLAAWALYEGLRRAGKLPTVGAGRWAL